MSTPSASESTDRRFTKVDKLAGVLGTVFFAVLLAYVVTRVGVYVAADLVTYLGRWGVFERVLQALATLVLVALALTIPNIKAQYPRFYYALGVISGVIAIWTAIDQVGTALVAAKSANVGTSEVAVLVGGMFIFAKSVEAWRDRRDTSPLSRETDARRSSGPGFA